MGEHVLRQPASLLRLLQRPVWLDAWRRGEEERASPLWRGLPNHVMLHILKLRTVNNWKTKFDCVILHLKRARAARITAAKIRYRRTLTCVAASNLPRGLSYVGASRVTVP
jgi:hypothetical protein|tara:strand:- start:269 stop:601 length:333 start_codon:yes stop_codon:yes gene_type:complete